MSVVEATVVMRMLLQILQVQRTSVSRNKALQFGRREKRQPFWIDDAAEAAIESYRLLAYLGVHVEKGHVVYVDQLVVVINHTPCHPDAKRA